jgi:hypothetical protein
MRGLTMRNARLRAAAGMLPWIMALSLSGCRTAQQQPVNDKAATEAARAADEAKEVAQSSLGKQAEILAQGDLALTGREQLLVVNRLGSSQRLNVGDANFSPILVTRAAVLEKNDGKWSQVLLCDEHLKNPNGYLGGSPKARVTGWRLEYSRNSKEGLEMNFTPAEQLNSVSANANQSSGQTNSTFGVRWNKSAKRYQSFDSSHERYLSEVPSLEIPESFLK